MMGTQVSPEGFQSWNVEEPGSDVPGAESGARGLGGTYLRVKERAQRGPGDTRYQKHPVMWMGRRCLESLGFQVFLEVRHIKGDRQTEEFSTIRQNNLE